MSAAIFLTYWLASLIVLAESLNKLERATPFAAGLTLRTRITDGLKALAWSLLALGSAGTFAGPILASWGLCSDWILRMMEPSVSDACTMVGFAVLIIRTRVKEG